MKPIPWKLGLFMVLATCLSHAQVIETRPYITVSGSDILLSDLAVNPDDMPSNWKTRPIGAAPAPGASLTYSLRSLAASLEPYKDMSAVWLKGPLHVTVLRDGISAPPAPLIEAIEAYVHEHAPWTGRQIAVACDPLHAIFNPPTNAAIKILSCDLARGNDIYRFEVVADTPERRVAQISITARISQLNKIWVIKHEMARGEVLTADDLEASLPPQGRSGRYIDVTENILGLELIRPVRTGQCVEANFLLQPLCARQGENVAVAMDNGSLRIVMRAKALASGRKNERILCMNEISGQKLMVRLTGTREAMAD